MPHLIKNIYCAGTMRFCRFACAIIADFFNDKIEVIKRR